MTKEEIIDLGTAADQFVTSAVYKKVWKAYQDTLKEQWAATRPDDTSGRERLYLMIQMLDDQTRMLTGWADNARVELAIIERAKRDQQ